MAGNRRIFEEAMRAGADAAWDKNWGQAIAAYQRALAEFPNDVGALTSLGLAYTNAGQLEAALGVYRRASERTPDDPTLYERIGELLERLDRKQEAADAYLASAERYLRQQQATHLALERWHDAVRVWPKSLQAHIKLLQYYQSQGQIREAVAECLNLAYLYGEQGRNDYAIQVCEHALKLDPHDHEVLAMLDRLRYGEQVAEEVQAAPSQEEQGALELLAALERPLTGAGLELELEEEVEPRPRERGTPVDITRQKALTDLAESFFEEEAVVPPRPGLTRAEIDALLGKAIDFQTRGRIDEAIAAYEKVLQAGDERPAVNFNLGLLYQEKLRFDDAIAQFERAVAHPEYTLGAHFALGECYRAKGRIDEALEHFIEVLKIVDLATVQRHQADDLIQLYESLADSYLAKGEREQAVEFTNALVKLLSDKGWEDKVIQARQRLDTLAQEGPTLSLADLLVVPGSERILESVSLAQEYSRRGMYYAALEECYYSLEHHPTYLPIHQQIAQILAAMGKIDEAVAKLVIIGDVHRVRGNIRAAMAVYQHALRMAPMDTSVRAKLIALLISHGEIDQALEHYMILAESYYNLAQIEQARDTYQEALRLAPRGSRDKRWEIRILHKIADIDVQRVDWKRAIEAYERIRDLAPDDERARLTLMDLYYRLNRPTKAIAELDGLLKAYRESGKTQRIFTILEDAVRERPDDIPLRARLAQAHLNAGHVEQALVHLDKLGDLQIEAGRIEEARATIRIIIALNPPNAAEYRQLLKQLA
jgi:tetratricopeptide (TPR) repeat protein